MAEVYFRQLNRHNKNKAPRREDRYVPYPMRGPSKDDLRRSLAEAAKNTAAAQTRKPR